ncbi:MAG: hypothetical protein Q8K86_08735 [Candidatus Nanopelagicaceae bacterium]|nr:hypothetical protein [Candidatus Nanopelagicaceae bacterium]
MGQHTIAFEGTSAWSLIAVNSGALADHREPVSIKVNKHYDLVNRAQWRNWKDVFAFSKRLPPHAVDTYQSKATFSFPTRNGPDRPDLHAAGILLESTLGSHMSEPIGFSAEFMVTHSLFKSKPLVIPLDLARYAAMFYLSSLVRYNPAVLDNNKQSTQAWLMDSLSREVPLNMLVGSLVGIRGGSVFFESAGYRV